MRALSRRYLVMALATEAPFDPTDPDAPFVLKPWKDAAALRALRTYRDNAFPALRQALDTWIRTIEAGPTLRGDVGRLNDPHLQRAPRAAGANAKRASATRVPPRRAKATPPSRKKRGKKPRR